MVISGNKAEKGRECTGKPAGCYIEQLLKVPLRCHFNRDWKEMRKQVLDISENSIVSFQVLTGSS